MTTDFAAISEKIILGITLAAPIGPVSVEMIKRGLSAGFWPAFSIRLGGALGQSVFLVCTYLGLAQLMNNPWLLNILGMLGACLLIYMGVTNLRKPAAEFDLSSTTNNGKNGLLWGLYLAIFNPVSLVFWPGIFAASMSASGESTSLAGFMLNMLIIVGVLLWGAGLSVTAAFGKKVLNKMLINIITKAAGLFMIGYGCKYAYQVWGRFC